MCLIFRILHIESSSRSCLFSVFAHSWATSEQECGCFVDWCVFLWISIRNGCRLCFCFSGVFQISFCSACGQNVEIYGWAGSDCGLLYRPKSCVQTPEGRRIEGSWRNSAKTACNMGQPSRQRLRSNSSISWPLRRQTSRNCQLLTRGKKPCALQDDSFRGSCTCGDHWPVKSLKQPNHLLSPHWLVSILAMANCNTVWPDLPLFQSFFMTGANES